MKAVNPVTDQAGAGKPMTAAAFRVAREYLGLTGDWLAAHLKVNPRTVRAWEQGRYPVPDGVRAEIERLQGYTDEFVRSCVTIVQETRPHPAAVLVYRTDAEYHAALNGDWSATGGVAMPASWHRVVAARVVQAVPALVIDYAQ